MECEPLTWWSSILMRRHAVYSKLASTCTSEEHSIPQLHQFGIKEKAWSINKLANIARKHGLLDVCIEVVNSMYKYSYMDICEAFMKIVEQAKAFLLMPDSLVILKI